MLAEHWILIIGLGALCGFIGQGLRIVVGLHKNANAEKTLDIDPKRLWLSLLIGILAGGLAAISTISSITIDVKSVLGLVAAGYAGADFIEGFAGRYLPK